MKTTKMQRRKILEAEETIRDMDAILSGPQDEEMGAIRRGLAKAIKSGAEEFLNEQKINSRKRHKSQRPAATASPRN